MPIEVQAVSYVCKCLIYAMAVKFWDARWKAYRLWGALRALLETVKFALPFHCFGPSALAAKD